MILALSLLRPVYVSTVRPQSKHIVVIVDHGASVTETQLQIAKDAAQVILSSIDEHDKVRLSPARSSFGFPWVLVLTQSGVFSLAGSGAASEGWQSLELALGNIWESICRLGKNGKSH